MVLVLWLGFCSGVGCDVCFRAWRGVRLVWVGMGAVASLWLRTSGCVGFVVL